MPARIASASTPASMRAARVMSPLMPLKGSKCATRTRPPFPYDCTRLPRFCLRPGALLTGAAHRTNNRVVFVLGRGCEGKAMQTHDRPRLRPHVVPAQNYGDPHHVYLVDQLGLAPGPRRLTVQEFHWVRLFDGARTLQDIHVEAVRQNGGQLLALDRVSALARALDDHLRLDGARYQGIVGANVRPPRCIGVYQGEPAALRRQIDRLFTDPRGPGRPGRQCADGTLRAVLVPHIDYPRGGHTYAWGFRELFERSDASLFVIIGTSHFSEQRFTLTRKDFATPLGVARTDQDYIDRLVKHYGDGLFDDELRAHLPEHSIELEVVVLQYLYERVRDIRIVPLVVGSFYD